MKSSTSQLLKNSSYMKNKHHHVFAANVMICLRMLKVAIFHNYYLYAPKDDP